METMSRRSNFYGVAEGAVVGRTSALPDKGSDSMKELSAELEGVTAERDSVILDAECMAEGVLDSHKELEWRWECDAEPCTCPACEVARKYKR